MLAFCEKVDGDPARVGSVVGDDEHFARAGQHVDAYAAGDLTLRLRDELVAGPDDQVHRWY